MTGTLYLVGTPIGNLEDMSFRAVRILKEVDRIACEDTRNTIKLLNHFEIKNRLESYHKFNENKEAGKLIDLLQSGENIALVSDAGLPIISDPGNFLVRKCREEGISVEVIPGPNAGLSALMLSGLDAGSFLFLGFLGKSKKEFRQGLKKALASEDSVILYESPHRIEKLLKAVQEIEPDRKLSISREITKKFEETLIGTAEELLIHFNTNPPKGEFVVILEGRGIHPAEEFLTMSIEEHVKQYTDLGLSEKEAMKRAAKERGVGKREIYEAIKL